MNGRSLPPVTYDEAISGDLPSQLPAGSVLAFDIGLNTVSGNSFYLPFSPLPNVDFDAFAFSIPVSAHLTQISYSFTPTFNPGTTNASISFDLDTGNAPPSFPPLVHITVDLLGPSPVAIIDSDLPLGPGVFGLSTFGLTTGGVGASQPGWFADFTWQFTVVDDHPVPEPASVLSLGFGLATLASRRWNSKRWQVPTGRGERGNCGRIPKTHSRLRRIWKWRARQDSNLRPPA